MTRFEQRGGSHEIAEAEAARIDMQAFDCLPDSYRNLIRYAQIDIPATVARAYLSAFGQRQGLLLLKWAVALRSRKIDERHGSAGRAAVTPPAPQRWPCSPRIRSRGR
jgi:hypothetical protein